MAIDDDILTDPRVRDLIRQVAGEVADEKLTPIFSTLDVHEGDIVTLTEKVRRLEDTAGQPAPEDPPSPPPPPPPPPVGEWPPLTLVSQRKVTGDYIGTAERIVGDINRGHHCLDVSGTARLEHVELDGNGQTVGIYAGRLLFDHLRVKGVGRTRQQQSPVNCHGVYVRDSAGEDLEIWPWSGMPNDPADVDAMLVHVYGGSSVVQRISWRGVRVHGRGRCMFSGTEGGTARLELVEFVQDQGVTQLGYQPKVEHKGEKVIRDSVFDRIIVVAPHPGLAFVNCRARTLEGPPALLAQLDTRGLRLDR